jgi:hypothetical protein
MRIPCSGLPTQYLEMAVGDLREHRIHAKRGFPLVNRLS